MVKALSLDLRVRVLAAVADGMSHHAVAQVFQVIPASVSRWRKLSRKTGELRAKSTGGDNCSHHVEAHRDLILIFLEEMPELTIEELRRFLADRGMGFSYGMVRRFFARRAVTRKKRPPKVLAKTFPLGCRSNLELAAVRRLSDAGEVMPEDSLPLLHITISITYAFAVSCGPARHHNQKLL